MKLNIKGLAPVVASLVFLLTSCGEDGLAEQCGLTCPSEGVLQGNASISGVARVDAFFGAVVSVRDASLSVSNDVRAELEGLAATLGVADYRTKPIDQLATEVKAAIQAKIQANVQGNLTVKYQPPRCQADIELTAKAHAECEANVDPGSVQVQCMGSCEVSAEVAAMCQANGNLKCEGQAPNFVCNGTCQGSCQTNGAVECSGTCNGTCTGTCSVKNANGQCAGTCTGTCNGECKLEAGGTCNGRCEGTCAYTPPAGGCEANATAKCDASAQANVQCQGKCEGEVKPPMASAECNASVEARAKAEVQCDPPQLTIDYQLRTAVELNANARAEFRAWLEGFRTRFAAMLAAQAKLRSVATAAQNLKVAGEGAVQASFDTLADGNLKAKIGVACAIQQLPSSGMAMEQAVTEATASLNAVASIGTAVGVPAS